MLKFVCTSGKSSFRILEIPKFLLIKISPFSSGKSVSFINGDDEKKCSFAVDYLVKRCGFPEKRAISVSKYLNFETPDRPDSVLALLKKHGFTDDQALGVVKSYPRILLCRPEKSILPKIEYFQSLGFKEVDICRILSSGRQLLARSLSTQIIPSCNVLRDMFSSHEELALSIGRCSDILTRKFQSIMLPNIEILREVGIPETYILNLLKKQPRVFLAPSDTFKECAIKLDKMGLRPWDKSFIRCLWRMSSINSSIWKRKVALYEIWGCSEDQVLEAFKKNSCTMATSEAKIMNVMKFLVLEMGYDSSVILKAPYVFSLSLKKTIIPRCSLYRVLLAAGLIRKNISLSSLLVPSKKVFLERYVNCLGEEAPEVLQIYEKLSEGLMVEDGKLRLKLN